MEDNKSQAKVEILGQEYIIKGDKTTEHITDIAAFLDSHLREVKKYNSSTSRIRIMILGSMNLADKLYQAQATYQELTEKYNQLEEDYKEKVAEYKKLEEKYKELEAQYETSCKSIDEED